MATELRMSRSGAAKIFMIHKTGPTVLVQRGFLPLFCAFPLEFWAWGRWVWIRQREEDFSTKIWVRSQILLIFWFVGYPCRVLFLFLLLINETFGRIIQLWKNKPTTAIFKRWNEFFNEFLNKEILINWCLFLGKNHDEAFNINWAIFISTSLDFN